MRVVKAQPGMLGVDSVEDLSVATGLLKSRGVGFVGTYLPSLTTARMTALVGSGLLVTVVAAFSRAPGWVPDAAEGTADGQVTVVRARTLGIPPGLTFWCDLEEVGGTAQARIAYANAWAVAVEHGGFDPGYYIGSGVGLTSAQLYDLYGNRYWHGCSRIIDAAGSAAEPVCGWAMLQLYPPDQMLGAFEVDWNVTQDDYEGRQVTMLAA